MGADIAIGGADGGGGGGAGATGVEGTGVDDLGVGCVGAADWGREGGRIFPNSCWASLLRVSLDESSSSSLLSSWSLSAASSQSESLSGAVWYDCLTDGGAGLLDGGGTDGTRGGGATGEVAAGGAAGAIGGDVG